MLEYVKIGADPELFAFDKKTGKPVSVHDLLPGTKHEPLPVPRGAIQVDGVAAEFNIKPARNQREFVTNIKNVSKLLQKALSLKNEHLELRAVPTVLFDKEYFDNLPFEAKMLGCEPDFSAYTGLANMKPETDKPMRTGSGHVHVQFLSQLLERQKDVLSRDHMYKCCELTKQLDAVLLPSSLVWDSDTQRRELYGAPGAFRPKKYGLEYRTLSNAWLRADWTTKFVFDATYNTVTQYLQGLDTKENLKKALAGSNSFIGFCNALESVGIPSVTSYAPKEVIEAMVNG